MGHVNHGKTSLIDCIKNTKLVDKEKGNITQNINAYYINNKYEKLTIIDTPGHSIFSDMRIIGINITDIIILIIAIDDGIMKETKEIINYSKKYNIPIIIVLNKIDKKEYINNIEKIKKKIYKYNIINNKLNKNNIFIKISTKLKIGIDKLIKNISLKKKKLKLKVNLNTITSGIILESKKDKKRGILTYLIIKKGILKTNDIILCNNKYGKIKAIFNDINKKINYALPSMPVKILGLKYISPSGNKFTIINNIKIVKKIIEYKNKNKNKIIKNNNNNYNINFFNNKKNKLNIIIKTNSYGSINTIDKIIKKNFNNIKIISSNIGDINKTDITLANISKSVIIAYNVKIENSIKKYIYIYKNKIYFFEIIHKIFNKLKKIIEKNNINKLNIKITGKAIIKNIFKLSKSKYIAGCKIINGYIKNNNSIKIIRNNKIICNSKIKSLKRFKKQINIAKKNTECGIIIKNFSKIKIGDIIESINN